MATGYGVPVQFTKEKNVWDLFGKFNIGSGGAINVGVVQTNAGPQTINKGFANVWQNTPTFTAVTASGSSTITSVSTFFGLFSGMAITNANITTGLTVGTISVATGSIILNGTGSPATGFTGSTGGIFVASGGQYILQFGVSQTIGSLTNNSRLDTYNRLLNFVVTYDSTTASAMGTATQQQLPPNSDTCFIVRNLITTKTIPTTTTTASTDASITVQFGTITNVGFTPSVLPPGLEFKAKVTLGNTTAP